MSNKPTKISAFVSDAMEDTYKTVRRVLSIEDDESMQPYTGLVAALYPMEEQAQKEVGIPTIEQLLQAFEIDPVKDRRDLKDHLPLIELALQNATSLMFQNMQAQASRQQAIASGNAHKLVQ